MKLSHIFLCGIGFVGMTTAPFTAFGQSADQPGAEIQAEPSEADALALEAQAILASVMSGEGALPDLAKVEEAQAAAEAAVALSPDHIDGRLQLAIALSLKTRAMTTRQVRKSGLGEQAKALVDDVLADDPDNINAHGYLTVWHLEVLRRGGRLGAAVMGASLSDARKHYAAAMAIDAQDASIHWQYARALALLDAKKHRGSIYAALEAATHAPCETPIEDVMQARAAVLLEALAEDGPQAAEALAGKML